MKINNYPQIQIRQTMLALFVALLVTAFSHAQCNPPTGVAVGNETATSATITWSASTSAPGIGYQYEVRTAGAPGSSVDPETGYVLSGNTADGLLTTTVQNLDISTTYYFYVRYQCGPEDFSTWTASEEIVTTTLLPPVATAAIYVSDDSFLARWNPSEGATSYRLDVSTASDFSSFVPNFEDRLVTITSSVVSELTPSTTYYYRVRAEGSGGEGPVTTGNSNTITVTTLAVPLPYVVWTEAGWSGDPLLELDAIIDWPFNTATDQVFEAKTLTINTGHSLTIASGTYIIVDNEIINNAGPTGLVIENNGNLLQLNDAAPANTGEVTVYRDSSPLFRLDYTMWSSPVVGAQTLQEFSPETVSTRFYTYTTATDLFTPHAPSNTFVQGAGYLIRTPNDHVPYVDETSTPEIWTGTFTGVPGNGEISVPLSTAGNGFNMIGNPYPSVVSAENFFMLNEDNIEGIVYFWRRRNSTTPGDTGSYYATYTNLGGTASDSSEVPNGFIQTGQGFIVQALPGATEVLFNNSVRVSDNFENQFFKNAQVVEKHRLWLNLTNTSGVFSQALVGYMDGATNAADSGIDGKYINDSDVALTSLLNNEEYVIQGRALPFEASDIVPLNFKTQTAGEYTISLASFDGLFADHDNILLEDMTAGTVSNLKSAPYTFSTEAGNFPDRFRIVYDSALGVNNPVASASSVIVYKANDVLEISAGTATISDVTIFDITGRKIYSKGGLTATQASVSGLSAKGQMVLVKVITDKGTVTKKVML